MAWKLNSAGRELNRREAELVRSTFESVRKVGIFIVLQAPPIIGLVPIVAAVTFPRQILTHHFWSDDEFNRFLLEEYNERKLAADQYTKSLLSALKTESIPTSLSEWQQKVQANESLLLDQPRENFDKLIRGHALFSANIAYRLFPSFLSLIKLNAKVLEIARDDVRLIREGLKDLERKELQFIAVRRGINPTLDSDELTHWIHHWLYKQIDCKCFIQQVPQNLSPVMSSALAHMIISNLSSEHPHPSLETLHPPPS